TSFQRDLVPQMECQPALQQSPGPPRSVATKQPFHGDTDVSESRCGDGAPWCARADELFNAPGLHVLEVAHDDGGRLVVTVESDEVLTGCRSCGVVAVGHGRRVHRVHDAPAFGTSVLIRWRKRIWRCPDRGCPVATFSETHELIAPR